METQTTLNGYQQNQVMNTSMEKLIMLLYEGAITFTQQAKEGLQNQDPVAAGMKLLRARNIVSELRNGLDYEQGGELAQNLERLYTYVHDELLRAGRENNPVPLAPVLEVLTTLKEGWKEVSQKSQSKESAATTQATYTPALANSTPGRQSELSIKV